MTAKKKLGLSIALTVMLVSLILVFVIQIIQTSAIQRVSLDECGYDYPFDELVAESHLIARGKFVGSCDAFVVEPTNGADNSVFTDYYFEITDVLRGDAAAGDTVSVRLQGGKKDNLFVENWYDVAPNEGSEAIVFLCKVTIPSVYVTNEDYYLPVGTTTRSFYYLDKNEQEITYKCDTYGREPIIWEEEKDSIISLSDKTPMNMSVLRESKLEELESSYKSGKLNAAEYNKAVAEIADGSEYAKRID